MVLQATGQVAAGTVDELGATPSDLAEVVDPGFVMQMSERMDLRLDPLGDMPCQRLRTDVHGLTRVHIFSYVQDALGWPVRNEDVHVAGDRLPNCVELRSGFHIGPIEKHGSIRGAKNLQSVALPWLVDQELDRWEFVTANQALFDGRRMISRNENFRRDIQRHVPIKKASCLRLVHPCISGRRLVTTMDHDVHVGWNPEPLMFVVRVRDKPNLHVTLSAFAEQKLVRIHNLQQNKTCFQISSPLQWESPPNIVPEGFL